MRACVCACVCALTLVVGENELLKKQLGESEDTLKQMVERHHHQIKEVMADLEAAREAHRKEVALVQEAVQQQSTDLTVWLKCMCGIEGS